MPRRCGRATPIWNELARATRSRIRIDPDPEERLVGRRIMEDERFLAAAPGLPVPLGGPDTVPAIGRAASPAGSRWLIRTEGGLRELRPYFRLRFSSFLLIREAVLAGAGVALVPKLLVQGDIVAGRLVCWGVQDGPKVEIWALQNSRRLSSSKVRAFLDMLASIT